MSDCSLVCHTVLMILDLARCSCHLEMLWLCWRYLVAYTSCSQCGKQQMQTLSGTTFDSLLVEELMLCMQVILSHQHDGRADGDCS